MKLLYRTLIIIALFAFAVCTVISSSALSENFNKWQAVEFIPANVKSGCELTYAAARIKYDYPSNKIRFVFMFDCNGIHITDESLVGICFNINGLGDVVIMADADMNFDNSVYDIAFEDVRIDKSTSSVLIEASVIIKKGLTPSNTMTAYFFDTHGVRSSSFTVDISDETLVTSTQSNKTDITQKTTKSVTVKTTKAKTTKTTKEKTAKADDNGVEETDVTDESELSSAVNIQTDERISEEKDTVKRIVLVSGAVTAAAAIAAGCVIGIKNSKKK